MKLFSRNANSPAFAVGERVVLVYVPGYRWVPWQVDLIGSCGRIVSIQDVEGFQSVQMDEGFVLRCRPQVLRKIDEVPRDDLRLVSWRECPWVPGEVKA